MSNENAITKAKKIIRIVRPLSLVAYLIIWAWALAAFYIIRDDSGGFGYTILYIYIVIPVSTFVTSVLFGAFNFGGKLKWIWPIFFGFMYALLEYVVYRIGNTIAFGNLNPPDKDDLMIFVNGLIVASIAIIVGHIVYLTVVRRFDLVKTKRSENKRRNYHDGI